jgi:hypothetical protein
MRGRRHRGCLSSSEAVLVSRRQFTRLVAAGLVGAGSPALPALAAALATSASPADLRFTVMRGRKKIGTHAVEFRGGPEARAVRTTIDLAVKVAFITAYRFRHDCEERWAAGRLVSLRSRTNDDGTPYAVEAAAEAAGCRGVGPGGPFLVACDLRTSNSQWDASLVAQTRLIDAQRGGAIGLVVHPRGTEPVALKGGGSVSAERFQVLTPLYGGDLWYDAAGRWVKGSLEIRGERIEYVLET